MNYSGISCFYSQWIELYKVGHGQITKPEQAGSLIALYNCKQSASALIHHLPYCSVKIK